MRQKKPYGEFIEELNKINPNIECIGEYDSMHKKAKFRCRVCNYEWFDTPSHILHDKRGCHRCNKKIRKTHEEFVEEVNQKFEKIEVLSKFTGVDNPIILRCKYHDYQWTTTPYSLMKGNLGCKFCVNEFLSNKFLYTKDDFCKKVNELTDGEYGVIGDYINSKTPILLYHTKCKHTFKMRPSNFLIYRSCPHCITPTKGEQKIIDYLTLYDINYEFQKYYDNLVGINNGLLSYDFYLPEFNLLIEYQGEFHDGKQNAYVAQNIDRQQEHDRRKRQYAKDQNIKLLEIWYWDFENIEKILAKELGLLVA